MKLLSTTLCRLVKGYLPPLPHAPLTVRKLVYFVKCIETPQRHCRGNEYDPRCYSFFFLMILLRL